MPPVNNKTLTRKQQDHKMKKQLLLIAILFCAVYTQAQEVFVNADFVSSYIWRGMDSGNASVQPSLGFNWKGLTVYAWGSTEFRHKNNEIDLSLEYEYKNLTLYANNYFTQTEDEPFKYFNYKAHSTGHTFEAGAGYMLCEKFPLSVSWYTTFAGNDYRENGKQLSVSHKRSGFCPRSRLHSVGRHVFRQVQCCQRRAFRQQRIEDYLHILTARIRKADSQPLRRATLLCSRLQFMIEI